MNFPIPDKVGVWGAYDEFKSVRPEDGQWVFWEDRVKLVLEGKYDKVKPLHVELSPTYLCNFACPWCSCRSARQDWSDIDIFNRPDSSDGTVMPRSRLRKIIDELIKSNTDIQWVGGEPTMHPVFYEATQLAAMGGLKQCLFTNGSLLHPKRMIELLQHNFEFIRLSLDAVTEEIHRKHHDYGKRRNYLSRVLKNLNCLIEAKVKSNASTLIGISFVIDSVNYSDLEASVEYLCELNKLYLTKGIDYIIIRPAFPFEGAEVCLDENMISKLFSKVNFNSEIRQKLLNAGIDLIVPNASFDAPEETISTSDICRSCGWFSEISPTGDMQLCSDRYGNPSSIIGNLEDANIKDIWMSKRREEVLGQINSSKCASTKCPKNGRGYHLNKIFSQIEKFRKNNELYIVQDWITDLRKNLPAPKHSFFL